VLFILALAFLVVMSGLFAGAETGMYQLSRLRLRLGVQRKRLPYVMLSRSLRDGSGLLLTMLIGNNLVNYLATSIVTIRFLGTSLTQHAAELSATAVTVPVLFVFGEVIPKNLFFFRADTLMPIVSPVLYTLHKILTWCGVVPALKLISGLFTRLTGLADSSRTVLTSARRHQAHALLQETHEEGLLSSVQSDIVSRLIGISHVRLRAVMTPMHDVETVDAGCDRASLAAKLRKCEFTRLPVVEGLPSSIVGFVSIYEVLGTGKDFTDLRDFIEPLTRLDAEITVTDAIGVMERDSLKIVLVTRAGRGGTAPARGRPLAGGSVWC